MLKAVLERGTTPTLERKLRRARLLLVSRLALVESARALVRLRLARQASEERLADAARELDALWARCDVWELSPAICDAAAALAPRKPLRTLDALHLATYVQARRYIEGLELVTEDRRLRDAARGV